MMSKSRPTYLDYNELISYRNQGHGHASGDKLRFYCPLHGGDNQMSLSLNPKTGNFKCFTCGCWGYVKGFNSDNVEIKDRVEVNLQNFLEAYQNYLTKDSPGAKYLAKRGIDFDLAKQLGLGWAPYGEWCHFIKDKDEPIRQPPEGRLVFPQYDEHGNLCNLYGRAIEINCKLPKETWHDHIPGYSRGVFNPAALKEPILYLFEGTFDALSLIQSGYISTCAIFGVNKMPWNAIKSNEIVFCWDNDSTGNGWVETAWTATFRYGIFVKSLPEELFKGCKDLNELYIKHGKIVISELVNPLKPAVTA